MTPENRYTRQMLLPEIGCEGQEALRRARVLLVGVGGLGSPIALALVGAGIGTLGIMDADVVSLTNLHRQLLYDETVLHQSKVMTAADRLSHLNAEVQIEPYDCRLTRDNAAEIIARYDIVVDGCDNYATRFAIDEACAAAGIPYVYGAVRGFEGQVSVFHYGPSPRRYTDLYPEDNNDAAVTLADRAIVGMTTGLVGNVMAEQVLKIVCGYAAPLAGRLWTVDLRTLQTLTFDF